MRKINKTNFILISIIFSICILIACTFSNVNIHNRYKQEIISNNAKIIANILKEHPEVEDDIIDAIIYQKGNEEDGKAILAKYGLNDYLDLEELKNIKRLKHEIIINNVIIISLAVFFYISIMLIYYLNTKKHIHKMRLYMENVLNNKYNIVFSDYDDGLLNSLKTDIYKMTIKLKNMAEYSNKEKKYLETTLSDISHQLKTPLTSLFVFNEILSQKNLTPKQRKEIASKIEIQLDRIKWLISSLLKMSQLDSGSVILKSKKENLYKIIEEAIEPFLISLELKNIDYQIKIPHNLKINCDKNWTIEALSNIIKNAYEHTNEKGNITITAIDNPLFTRLFIKDTGSGIKKEDISKIFQRFYHGNSNKDSIGIGLNMSKMIIEKQKGSIEVESTINIGTTFIITFYKNR